MFLTVGVLDAAMSAQSPGALNLRLRLAAAQCGKPAAFRAVSHLYLS